MILPANRDHGIRQFLSNRKSTFVGCLSFEQRSISAPSKCFGANRCSLASMLRVVDPKDAFPYYGDEIDRKINTHRDELVRADVPFDEIECDLLATEDQLIDVEFRIRNNSQGAKSVVLDITSLPKRYFVFLVKRLMRSSWCQDLLVIYTTAGKAGYTKEHLATDILPCDHLPGMAGKTPLGKGTLVVSLGFEELNMRSIMQEYHGRGDTRFIMSFPVAPEVERRQWAMLRQLLPAGHSINLNLNVQPIAGWDVESVYNCLATWNHEHPDLIMAPFGIKTHTLGMALFAIEHNCGMYYTQPQSYNPAYTGGVGEMYGYIVKWEGVPAYERHPSYP